MAKKKFNFIEEVYSMEIDVEIFREMEAYSMLATFKDEESEEWNIECLLGNYTDYLIWKDDLFLEKLVSIYSEEDLREMLELADDIVNNGDKDKILLVNDKKYEIKSKQ